MLYIVGTPIGNLRDLSLRQAETIHNAKVVLCEDTRSTVFLIQKIRELFGFTENKDRELISYYKDKEFEKLPRAIETLEEGRDIVLISQAGMPLISDPGSLLVREVIRRNIPYTVIPDRPLRQPPSFTAVSRSAASCFAVFSLKRIRRKEIARAFQARIG
jgi:16S rRNA (cytidine1402-2'-O)-methyltransferase